MNKENLNADESRLTGLLREARPSPSLPPRFQENVWRRIEGASARAASVQNKNWLDVFAGWILRPQLALVAAAVLIIAGVGLGWSHGERDARQQAQARYLTAVAPNLLR